MLPWLLAAALQAAPAPAAPASSATAPAAAEKPIDVTASIMAYMQWRLCLDGVLGPPPRPRPPKPKALEAAFAACRPKEEALGKAVAEAFGPADSADMFERFRRDTRAELGAPPEPR